MIPVRFCASVLAICCHLSIAAVALAQIDVPPISNPGYVNQIGFTQLKTELGSALPTGTGIRVGHIESGSSFLPDPLSPELQGKNFIYRTSGGYVGEHSTYAVARYYYGSLGIAPGIKDIEVWRASDWTTRFLGLGTTSEPGSDTTRIHSSSWSSSYGSDHVADTEFALRYDYAINKNGYLSMDIVANQGDGPTIPRCPGNEYNGITCAKTNGLQVNSLSTFDTPGRCVVDIVADRPYCSQVAPLTGAAAALLLQRADADSTMVDARDNPEPIKAILMAGCTKNIPGWSRTQTRPLDQLFGAGNLNVYNSYHILTAGEQHAGVAQVQTTGWDYAVAAANAAPARYTFDVPTGGSLKNFSVILTWNRIVTDGNADPSIWSPVGQVANLDLRLTRSDGLGGSLPVDASLSTIDNVEHVYQTALSPGTYTMEISSSFAGTNLSSIDYGLAWQGALTVPEPATLALLALGGLALIRRRHKA